MPPGCEEIPTDEHHERECASLDAMRDYFAEAHPGTPEQHPSVGGE